MADHSSASGIPSTAGSLALRAVDGALAAQSPLVRAHLEWLRRNRPDATPQQIIDRLTTEYRLTTLGTGAGAGALSTGRTGGAARALAVGGTEAAGFLQATALYVMTLAEIHGVDPTDLDRRRTLLLAIMLGQSGAGSVRKVVGRTGTHWARALVKAVPASQIRAVNKVLGKHFVTRWSTKQGVLVLGQVVPLGVGAALGGAVNVAAAHGVVKAAQAAFGPAPQHWRKDLAEHGEVEDVTVVDEDAELILELRETDPDDPGR